MTAQPLASALSLQGLRYRYRGGAELAYADLDVPQGRHLLLRGASGSGKSTLLALMAGLLTPGAGEIVMAGTRLRALSARAADAWRGRCLGFVPQRLHLSAALSVLDNLRLPYVCAGLRADELRLRRLLTDLGIEALASRRPHELSVGQAQRVAIARALVRAPQLLLADEPSSSLDDEAAGQMLDLLLRASAEHGASLVLATHDARVPAQLQRLGVSFSTMELPRQAAASMS